MKDMKHMKLLGGYEQTLKRAFMLFMCFMVSSSVIRGRQQGSQAPVFKSKVEIVQLDVSVLDKHRQPVKGLTERDFTVLEDGKPQKIVGFSTFDLDTAAAPATGWMKDVPPDVTTNDLKPEARLFVIVMDDALTPQEPFSIKSAKEIAANIIDKLGPNDLTAIVFTGDNRKTQDFTSDKTKLRAALEKFNPGQAAYRYGLETLGIDADLYFYQSAVRTLGNIADTLATVPNRRKAVLHQLNFRPASLAILRLSAISRRIIASISFGVIGAGSTPCTFSFCCTSGSASTFVVSA